MLLGDDGGPRPLRSRSAPSARELERKRLIAGIRERADGNRFKTVVAGGPMLVHDAAALVDEDGRKLGWVSTLALAAVIGILFRKVRWVVLPLAVVHVTLVWTKALLWLVEARLSMVSTTLTALVTVIGVASVVQVTARYREERERADVVDALLRTMSAAGPAVFWASLTTAAGFASLYISSIAPVRNFAIMMSLASALVFVVAAALGPGVVTFGKRSGDPGERRGSGKSNACSRRRWTGASRGRGRWPSSSPCCSRWPSPESSASARRPISPATSAASSRRGRRIRFR